MQEKEELILNFMQEDTYVSMKAKEMALLLSVPKEEYRDFTLVLQKLEEDYKIQKNRKDKYRLIDRNKYITGIFRANERGFGFVALEENQKEEIFVSRNNAKSALNGDTVLVEIMPEGTKENHKEGRIVKILKHNKTSLVGIFQNSKNFGFVVPDDNKFGTDVFISKNNFKHAKNNDKVVVEIVRYPEERKESRRKNSRGTRWNR